MWARADFLHAVENAMPCKKSAALCESAKTCGSSDRGELAKVELGVSGDRVNADSKDRNTSHCLICQIPRYRSDVNGTVTARNHRRDAQREAVAM